MAISPLAGKPAPKDLLVDLANLERAYFDRRPEVSDPNLLVAFGTSGHRRSPLRSTFTEAHILAITQAICDYRRGQGTDGRLFMGRRRPSACNRSNPGASTTPKSPRMSRGPRQLQFI